MKTGVKFCLVFIVFLGAIPAVAADSGNVNITGSVPVSCDLDVAAEAGASNIANIASGDTNRLVATVTETCNASSGYSVTLLGTNSTNHTGLFIDSVSTDSHPFTLNYNGSAVNAGGVVTDVAAPTDGVDKSVRISYGSNAGLTGSVAPTYTETITFTITAK